MIITIIASKPVAPPVCQAWFSVLHRCLLSREVKYLSSWGSQDVTEGSLAQGMPALNPLPPSPKDRSNRAQCGMLRAVGGTRPRWPSWQGSDTC